MTLSKMTSDIMFSVAYAECRVFDIVIMSFILVCVVMLIVIMLNVVMLIVIMLNVVAPVICKTFVILVYP